jgi:hypothetical protein
MLIHIEHLSTKESGGGWKEEKHYAEYHLDPQTRQIKKRIVETTDDCYRPEKGYDGLILSEEIIKLEDLPPVIRFKVETALLPSDKKSDPR